MFPLATAILVASLLGSTHCAGMCGAFVLFAVGTPGSPGPSRLALNAAYNLGRLATYVSLGGLAGLLGAAFDLGGSAVGVQRAAASAAGVIMAGFGVVAVLRHAGVKVPRVPLPGLLIRVCRSGHVGAASLPPLIRAGVIGLLTTLLPCGWLYAFVVASAGTGSVVWGAACMAVFWLGTLPIMAGLGLGIQSLLGPVRAHAPLVTSLIMVAVGLLTVWGRTGVPAVIDAQAPPSATAEPSLHPITGARAPCPLCWP